jgi:8-oxo-dGTP diphosphatase
MGQPRRNIRVVAGMIEKDGRYLITQRRPTATLPLLWEFPGGRVEENESDEAALARELKEEMGIDVRVSDRVVHVEHAYPDYTVDFRVYRCALVSDEIKHIRVHDHRWVLPTELERYEFPAADEKTMRQLLAL